MTLRLRLLMAVLCFTTLSYADYLEIRRSAHLKAHPGRNAKTQKKLEVNDIVLLISEKQREATRSNEKQREGYYHAETQDGRKGWVYRTLVRRHRGDPPSVPDHPERPDEPIDLPDGPISPDSSDRASITIASFNIQDFGATKAGKPEIMETLAGIVRKYDLVAVQEISNSAGVVPGQFLDLINSDGSAYEMTISPRSGLQEPNSTREQYGYYYNTETVEAVGAGLLFDDEEHDRFKREPYFHRFTAGSFDFVLGTIHTQPESAVREIGALHTAYDWALGVFAGVTDIIILGDFNASCTYARPKELNELAIRSPLYTWVVPDTEDTTVRTTTHCAYDHMLFRAATLPDYTGRWGVDRSFTDIKVSDHWPVWAQFFVE